MADPKQELERAIGGPVPPAIAELEPEQLAELTVAVTAARDRQREALGDAIDNGLNFVPRILRATVKKVLF